MPNSLLRTLGLTVLIFGAFLSSLIDFFKGNSEWGWLKIMIAILVIAHEIYRYMVRGETISTKYKKFIQAHPIWGYLSLGLFTLALAGLILHLSVW